MPGNASASIASISINGEPLFRTVGNDSTFYRPPTANQLRRYLNQIPEDFEMCFKVWEEITIPSYAKQPATGPRAGQPNPRFLDAKLFNELVLTPYREAKFEPHTGPFLFEFQRHGMSAEEFCSRLDGFLRSAPERLSVCSGDSQRLASSDLSYLQMLSKRTVSPMSIITGPTCRPWRSNTHAWSHSQRHSRCCAS